MDKPLLNDPEVFPSPEVLEEVLGSIYPVLDEFLSTIGSEEFNCTPEWRFYKDGHAWLCKITFKKTTAVWLSVWEACFKVALYFTEKSGGSIPDLPIDDSIKEAYLNHKPIGKLKPVIIETSRKSQLQDIYTLVRYKTGQG